MTFRAAEQDARIVAMPNAAGRPVTGTRLGVLDIGSTTAQLQIAEAVPGAPPLPTHALKQRILVTTPSTLRALLKVIAYGWRQTKVTENAREIRELGQDLHKRLNVFVNHLQKVGRSLGKSTR